MLVRDIMTRNVVTVESNTPVGDAQKIMKERGFRRLPVVDGGRPVGMVTEHRLEQVKPGTAAPLMWQITYLIAHTRVRDVMRKKVVTVKPTDTVEQAVAKAQSNKVGALLVVDRNKVVGICTTNDFFYRIVNPALGLGEAGSRVIIYGAGDGKSAQKVISRVNGLDVPIRNIWTPPSTAGQGKDLVLHLGVDDARKVIEELAQAGYSAAVRNR